MVVNTFAALCTASAADTGSALEYKVKAGYLFNFGKFIEWPEDSFADADSPFVIAVMDNGEAAPIMEQVLRGKKINGHPVEVRRVVAGEVPKGAHILLVTRAAGRTPEEVRAALGDAPTLLVGETDHFAERGGAIGFVREDESVRLTLCLIHATQNGLKVSARLSSVARSVYSEINQ